MLGNKTLYHHMLWQATLVLTCHEGWKKGCSLITITTSLLILKVYGWVNYPPQRRWAEEKEEQDKRTAAFVHVCVCMCTACACVSFSLTDVALFSLQSRQSPSEEDKCLLSRNPIKFQYVFNSQTGQAFIVILQVKWIKRSSCFFKSLFLFKQVAKD